MRDFNRSNGNRKFSGNSSGRYDESYGNRPGRGSAYPERRPYRDSSERVEFSATCDECGKPCKLPFRPTSNKPVYCRDCFSQRGERSGLHNDRNSNSGNYNNRENTSRPNTSDSAKEIRELKDQVISLNVKLEKIMQALNIKAEKPREPMVVKVNKQDYAAATTQEMPEPVAEAQVTEVVTVKKAAAKKKTAKTTRKPKAA